MTRISINFIVPSVNSFSCSNFDKLKLSENYLDNLDKIKNIIYYPDKKNQEIIRIPIPVFGLFSSLVSLDLLQLLRHLCQSVLMLLDPYHSYILAI